MRSFAGSSRAVLIAATVISTAILGAALFAPAPHDAMSRLAWSRIVAHAAPYPMTFAAGDDGRHAPSAVLAAPSRQPKRGGKEGRGGQATNPDKQPGLIQEMTAFKTDVPAHDLDVILARPTDHSITVSITTAAPSSVLVEYWLDGTAQRQRSKASSTTPGAAANIELSGLRPNTEYQYRVGHARDSASTPTWGDASRFRTKAAPGTPFTFVIQADSHLDQGVEPKVYEQTLANMLAAKPDLVVDLGDTFMTDKRGRDFRSALPQYDAQRYYFGLLAHSAPLFMALGNHDGEKGSSGRNAEDIGPWSYAQRTRRFPEPVIDGAMYTGATGIKDGVGSNYYAFEWGDALFIVLDPFWNTTERIRGGGTGGRGNGGPAAGERAPANQPTEVAKPTDSSWAMTLGRTQYDWLAQTLSATNAKYRFVFIHHLIGGAGGPEARGGVESSHFFEWGGDNADATPGFAEHRPGWPMPIHDLLAKHHVSAVFHGHDHLYVHSQRDGVQYQCVPQPGNPAGNTRSAAQYGYASGTLFASPGHVRVQITPQSARVEFVRTAVANLESVPQRGRRGGAPPTEANGAVVDSYLIPPAPTPAARE